ncbi:MAG: cell division protein FtsQ/DivIB, partial [bacterium]
VLPNLELGMLLDYPIISKVENQSRELNNILNYLRFIKTNQFTLYSEISEISYSPKMGIYFYLTEGTIPVFMGEQDFEQKGSNLLAVLNILNKEKKLSEIEYFDLRFKGQVIVKEIVRS